jgi:hypothetical protein
MESIALVVRAGIQAATEPMASTTAPIAMTDASVVGGYDTV